MIMLKIQKHYIPSDWLLKKHSKSTVQKIFNKKQQTKRLLNELKPDYSINFQAQI